MKVKLFKMSVLLALLFTSVYFLSCQKDLDSTGIDANNNPLIPLENPTAKIVGEHPGRALAANCFQCHGTNGYGWEHLAGEDPSEIIEEMNELKVKNPRSHIMNVHAAAYTPAEVQLIADFFSQQ